MAPEKTTEGKWHFVGIGGVGMSGIAKARLELGKPVSGSDLVASSLTDQLSEMGAVIHIGRHDPAFVTDDLEAVVVSSAIRRDNPEILAAGRKGIPVIHRGSCLGRLMAYKDGIAVAGAHGKTTTSAMVAWLLMKGGRQPAYFIGAYVGDLKTNASWGPGRYMVAEADESDGSFLELWPEMAIVTNVEDDHLDYYGSIEKIDEAFLSFINRIPESGCAILCTDDAGIQRILPKISHHRIVSYGFGPDADLRADRLHYENGQMKADVYWAGKPAGALTLRVHGRHNILNALGAMAAGHRCGLAFSEMEGILGDFCGAQRRLEYMGQARGILFYDDYAHHPTEIRATLEAAGHIGAARLLVLYQPHRYTRTMYLADRFGPAFDAAAELILLPIYSAGEDPIDGVSEGLIAAAVRQAGGRAPLMAADFGEACDMAEQILKPGDLFLTMGAGSVRTAGEMLLRRLQAYGAE